jgi:thioredoxin 1
MRVVSTLAFLLFFGLYFFVYLVLTFILINSLIIISCAFLPPSALQVVTLEEVEDIIRQAKEEGTLVVIDFYSQNCPPCKMIAPLYEELSEEFEGVVRFLKLDVNANPDTTAKFRVDGWPTFLFVKNGEVQEEIIGGNAAKLGLYDMVVKYA